MQAYYIPKPLLITAGASIFEGWNPITCGIALAQGIQRRALLPVGSLRVSRSLPIL
jgi:hypothetical protein